MGRAERAKPKFLADKLKAIRRGLNVRTYDLMIARLNYPELPLNRSSIAQYEKGEREPPLPVLLRYARLANVYLEVLVDDELDLPDELPSLQKSEGIERQ